MDYLAGNVQLVIAIFDKIRIKIKIKTSIRTILGTVN